MRHVALTTAAVFAAAVAMVACEQQVADQNPTAPEVDLSFAKQLGGQCDAARLRAIQDQQKDQWANPYLAQAQTLFSLVEANCSVDIGKSYMLDYIQWTIDNRTNRKAGTTNGQLIVHWNTVFPYVGYVGANQPLNVPDSVFTVGGAKVIDGGVTDSLNTPNAALTFFAQNAGGDLRDHLFVIYPIPANCLTGSNLQQFGPCYQFSAFPHANAQFDPKIKLGICEVHSPSDEITNHITSPALGHLDPITRITNALTSHYPGYCFDAAALPQGSWNNGFGAAVTRLAWMAKRAITPTPAYAVHGGLGGLGGGISPVGAVDLEVFRATFTNNTVGQQPGAPETGTWQIVTLTPPGSILVQSSLGQLNSKLVVLQQSGGNCKNCGGLYLRGNLESAGSQATTGTYDAEFDAVQAQTNMKEAVFALRDSSDVNIATITFAVRNNTNLILYNDKNGSPQKLLGSWVQNVPVHFRIRVSLGLVAGDARSTEVWVNNAATSSFANVPFLANAANFSRIAADFRGIDSGTMGWDNIIVTRLSDETP